MSRDLTLPTRSRGWGKTEAMTRETALRRAAWAFADLGDIAGDAAASLRQFNRSWGGRRLRVTLPPAAIKPAFRGRRHGWRR